MLFNYLNDILFYKKGNKITNIDDESQYNSYMVNRWLSMYSPKIASIVNLTTNRYHSVFSEKIDHYNFSLNVLPKSKPYRIQYFKKSQKQKEEASVISLLAKNLELSEREINYYVKTHKINLNQYDCT